MTNLMVLLYCLAAVADYNPIASPPLLSFPMGSIPGTEVCYDLTLESDNLVEGFESFLTIIVPVGTLLTTIAGRDQAEVVIIDLTCNIVPFELSYIYIMYMLYLQLLSLHWITLNTVLRRTKGQNLCLLNLSMESLWRQALMFL